jgi:parvulin-like peptidyl-prolyl isomerase
MAIIVNGERIEDESIRQEADRMRPRYEEAFADEEPDAREARLLEWARENAIERVLFVQEARRDPKPVPPAEVEQALDEMRQRCGGADALREQLGAASDDAIRQDIELRLRVERLNERICRHVRPPSDEAVERYYREHADEFMAPEQVRAAHIVKHVGPTADPRAAQATLARVREELGRGADFAAMAAEHSDCPDDGGDLGYFARGQMVEEFEHLVFSMAVGQVSHVFPTRFGFHIVKLLDRKPPAPLPLEQVREHVQEALNQQLRNEAVEKHLDDLRAQATIEEA